VSEGLSLVIDTDTASDDAIALILAARSPGVSIRAVTVVAGNVPLSQATRNALVTLEMCGAGDVPVYEGRSAPLMRKLETAQYVHGEDGMGGVPLPEPVRQPEAEHAVDLLRRLAREEPGRHTLVTLGPLSNVATALLVEPDLLSGFNATFCMAGALDGVGNAHPAGEYNVWADPEAADIVFNSSGEPTLIGWDISRRYAVFTPEEQASLRAVGKLGAFAVDINAVVDRYARTDSGLPGFDLPDPIAMAVALDPGIVVRQSRHRVHVGLDDRARGATMVDHRRSAAEPNVRIVWEVDEAAFKAMVMEACTEKAPG
jgi:purine nucleosidase